MKTLTMLLWVTQFGLSIMVPPCLLLLAAVWLQQRFGWGMWIVAVMGILGVLISVGTARANWRAMRKEAENAVGSKTPPIGFNNHE